MRDDQLPIMQILLRFSFQLNPSAAILTARVTSLAIILITV